MKHCLLLPKESYYGQKVKEELYPAGKEGTVVPDFKVKDKSGKEVALSTLRQGKKYVLIEFLGLPGVTRVGKRFRT